MTPLAIPSEALQVAAVWALSIAAAYGVVRLMLWAAAREALYAARRAADRFETTMHFAPTFRRGLVDDD